MSLADYDDISRICKDWETEVLFEDFIVAGLNGLSNDALTYRMTSRTNRWEEIVEDILNEKRDGVLV